MLLFTYDLLIFDREGNGENMSSRLETLVDKFGLRDCLVQGEDLSAVPLTPNYDEGYRALEKERKKSKDFLDMVFAEAKRIGL